MNLEKYQKEAVKLKKEIKSLEEKKESLVDILKVEHDAWINSIKKRDIASKKKAKLAEDKLSEVVSKDKLVSCQKKDNSVKFNQIKDDYAKQSKKLDKAAKDLDKLVKKAKIEEKDAKELKDVANMQISNYDVLLDDIASQKSAIDKENKLLDAKAEKIKDDRATIGKNEKALKNLIAELKKENESVVKEKMLVIEKTKAQEIGLNKLDKAKEKINKAKEKNDIDSKYVKDMTVKLAKKEDELKETENNLIIWNQKLIKRDQLRQNAK